MAESRGLWAGWEMRKWLSASLGTTRAQLLSPVAGFVPFRFVFVLLGAPFKKVFLVFHSWTVKM